MKKEIWLKIGSVLIYLFAPPLIVMFFFSFLEVLFQVDIDSIIGVVFSGAISFFATAVGCVEMDISNSYILKQKDKWYYAKTTCNKSKKERHR